jgi:hypothetical protein
MECAKKSGIPNMVLDDDYDPEPEGFLEFLEIVIGGPTGLYER